MSVLLTNLDEKTKDILFNAKYKPLTGTIRYTYVYLQHYIKY